MQTSRHYHEKKEELFLLIVAGMFFPQVGPVCPFIGLYVYKTAFLISDGIDFFATRAAVSCSRSHNIHFKLLITFTKVFYGPRSINDIH